MEEFKFKNKEIFKKHMPSQCEIVIKEEWADGKIRLIVEVIPVKGATEEPKEKKCRFFKRK